MALCGDRTGRRLHALVESHLKRALALWFDVGQLAAVPTLISAYELTPGPARVDPRSLPGGIRFEAWCLTDR